VAVDAGREPPRARGIALVLTGADAGIDNRAARAVAARWQRHGVAVTVHEFERALGVNHDMVDPDQPDAKVALVYPVLLDLISP
jgi:carboxylesterase